MLWRLKQNPRAKGCVEKPVIEGLDFVGTGLVEFAKSRPWRGPCSNSSAIGGSALGGKSDSHEGCPYDDLSLPILSQKGLFQQSL